MRLSFWILLFIPIAQQAQDLKTPDIRWSTLIGGTEEEEVADIVELPNGYIAGVGFTTSKWNKGEDQYYFILDSGGKKMVERNYGSLMDDRALGLTSTFDGQFVYCGYIHPVPNDKRHSPNIRKVGIKGETIWNKIESGIRGVYQDLVELTPNHFIVIGKEDDQASIFAYSKDSLVWKKKLPGMGTSLRSIHMVSDHTFLVAGQTDADKLLWYALFDDKGNQLWAKRGVKGYGTGLALAKDSDQFYWIGGSYYDARKREDAYLIKINIANGDIITKLNFGERYDDVLSAISIVPGGPIYLTGKTYSHIRAGARRSKAWMLKIDPVTGKAIEQPWIWGGRQNNSVTSMVYSFSGHLILGAWTASGEAERKDGWIMKIPSDKYLSDWTAGIDLVDLRVIEDNGDGKIGYTESSAFQVKYKPSGINIPAVPKLTTYIDDQRVGFDVILNKPGDQLFNIPYYRQATMKGTHQVKIILTDGRNKPLDSLKMEIEFLGPELTEVSLKFEQPILREKLDSGQAVIDLPVVFSNTGSVSLKAMRAGIQGLEDLPFKFTDTLIDLGLNESKKSILTITPRGFLTEDTLSIVFWAQPGNQVIHKQIRVPIKALLTPWMNARKEQTSFLLAEKLQSGKLTALVREDYRRFPLDSFFKKQTGMAQESARANSQLKAFDPDKIFTIWIDPDPVIYQNYFTSKRNSYPVLLKLINQDHNAEGLIPRLLIERSQKNITDTVELALDQGVLLGSYQYNLQADIMLIEGENKVRLGLWYRDELIKTSSPMIIHYEPPRSNLFVYAYGIPDPSLIHVTKDARDLVSAFKTQEGKLFSNIQAQAYNEVNTTTTQAIRKSIRDIVHDYYEFKRIRKDDVILIYFSSHGSLLRDEFYLHPSDYDPLYEEETTINLVRDIQDKLRDIPCKKILMIDACHSGAAVPPALTASGQKSGPSGDDLGEALVRLSEASNDFYFLLSSSAGEYSYTDAQWGNSAFTKAILEAFANRTEHTLQGPMEADLNRNKILDMNELYLYIKERVPVIIQSKKDLKSSQTPFTPDPEILKNLAIYVIEKP